ncbi:MFS transporter [Nocardioides bigeumensis]|uniref:MFS transporter n=1 Tax=Nocardioides bigeumensis TaxID=433657 RepID=A0ABN2YLT3_9ACTN
MPYPVTSPSRTTSRFRELARNHDFTVLWVGQTVSELGTRISMFVFPLIAYAVTGSVLWAGLVGSAELVGLTAALLPAGVLADRVDRRLVLRCSAAAGALSFGSLTGAALLGAVTLPHLMAVAVVSGAAAGVFMPTELAAVRTVVPREQLPAALSQNQARQHVAALVGGPVGGALYGVARWLPFLVNTVTFAFSWLMLGRLRTDLSPAPRPAQKRSAVADLREGASYAAKHPLFRTLTIWSCLTNLTMNVLFTVAVLRLVEGGVDPLHIGLVETVAGGSGILGAVLAPWLIDRVPTGWLTIAIAWSPLPLVVPMAIWAHPAVVAAALGCVLVLNPAGNAGMSSYRISVTPDALVARVQSATQFVGMSSLPLAPVVAGGLLSLTDGATAILVAGLLCGLTALIPTGSRWIRSVPRPADWDTAQTSEPLAGSRSVTQYASPEGSDSTVQNSSTERTLAPSVS